MQKSDGLFWGHEKNFSRSPSWGRAQREGLTPGAAQQARGQAPERKIVLLSLRARKARRRPPKMHGDILHPKYRMPAVGYFAYRTNLMDLQALEFAGRFFVP
jgi:hypothetical protein